ncbi:winged helix-turn-helix transcriptional regulator [Kitasatospora viridis]|uniref:HxlR family transcriptional regulator n=1 Tax=Kitasatospora viridis TaxID=281105 RepID=A0A561SEY9_9ACTN|nr:helix-turn-helix domain-containing protein [Kitasatospora viridis]TWF73436.1 HxlR family transcriptional regulator [Kitasatospora viridis]
MNKPAPPPAVSYGRDCPTRTVVDLLANKWTLYVLAALREASAHGAPLRFNQLRRQLDGVTQKMLTQTLRALERDGLISRTVLPTSPLRVEYALTPLGHEAGTLTTAIAHWSVTHIHEILTHRESFTTAGTGAGGR